MFGRTCSVYSPATNHPKALLIRIYTHGLRGRASVITPPTWFGVWSATLCACPLGGSTSAGVVDCGCNVCLNSRGNSSLWSQLCDEWLWRPCAFNTARSSFSHLEFIHTFSGIEKSSSFYDWCRFEQAVDQGNRSFDSYAVWRYELLGVKTDLNSLESRPSCPSSVRVCRYPVPCGDALRAAKKNPLAVINSRQCRELQKRWKLQFQAEEVQMGCWQLHRRHQVQVKRQNYQCHTVQQQSSRTVSLGWASFSSRLCWNLCVCKK